MFDFTFNTKHNRRQSSLCDLQTSGRRFCRLCRIHSELSCYRLRPAAYTFRLKLAVQCSIDDVTTVQRGEENCTAPEWREMLPYALFPPSRCRSAVGGQPISVLVTSSVCIRKDISSISVLTCNGNGSYVTEERQRYSGTAQRQKGTAERNGNGRMATEWWKPRIRKTDTAAWPKGGL